MSEPTEATTPSTVVTSTTAEAPSTTTTEPLKDQVTRWQGATFNPILGRWNRTVIPIIEKVEAGDHTDAELDCRLALAEFDDWVPDAAPRVPDDQELAVLVDAMLESIEAGFDLCAEGETFDARSEWVSTVTIIGRTQERVVELGGRPLGGG